MSWIDPITLLSGTILIAVPHMDDAMLACAGTLAHLPDKACIHIVYATDGKGSPKPILPWRHKADPNLGQTRTKEARKALGSLGIPSTNIHFLALPDGKLQHHQPELQRYLVDLILRIRPQQILLPFRYDRHRDHLAVNWAITKAHQQGCFEAAMIEYFVYHYWRMLPLGDVRRYIAAQHLRKVDITAVSAQKLTALNQFKSQTTRFYEWQTRPNLTPQLLSAVSQEPECFLCYEEAYEGATIFTHAVLWIRIAHRLEPFLKKKKDQAVALWRTLRGKHVS